MAGMLSSYTLLSRPPAVLAPGPKFSPADRLQLRKQPPAVAAVATASVVAVSAWPSPSGKQSRSRRASVFVCHAKYDYKDIQPSALKTPALEHEDYSIKEDKDRLIIVKLRVGEPTSKDQLKVETVEILETTDDLELLVIKYTGDVNDDSPASSLDLRLLVPPGYDGKKVKAKLFKGWLVVAMAKPKHDPNQIFFDKDKETFYYDANKIPID